MKRICPLRSKCIFRLQRLLHFHDHLGLREDLPRRVDDLRARGDVIIIGKTRAQARLFLHQNSVTAPRERERSGGDQPDSMFLLL